MLDAGTIEATSARSVTTDRDRVLRNLLAVVVVLVVAALVTVVSVPRPLTRYAPEWALAIDPTHPVALLAKADLLRERFLDSRRNEAIEADPDPLPGSAAPAVAPARQLPGARRFAAPHLRPAHDPIAMDRATLQREITALAQSVVAADPLNAKAYRMLGEVADDPVTVRRYMRTAVALSRRETLALFWLFQDASDRSDLAAVVDYADQLLRTQPALLPFAAPALAKAAEDEAGRHALLARLARGPDWRSDVLAELPKHVAEPRTPLVLLAGLRDAEFAPTQAEIQAYLAALLEAKEPELAHDAWRALLPRRETSPRGQLHNGDFDRDPSGYAFDWMFLRGQGAAAEVVPQVEGMGRGVLRLTFDGGRVVVPSVRQVALLKPGRHSLSGRFKGAVATTRGLRWQVRCLYGARDTLGETEMLLNSRGDWQTFGVDFEVIDIPDCRAQLVTVIHDARMSSEHVMSGEMQFDDLVLRPAG